MYRYSTEDVHRYFWLQEKCLEDVSATSLVLHAQNFASAKEKNVAPKFTNRLGLTLHKYANIKVFSKPIFPVYGQNPRTYTRKYVSKKTSIFAYFTQREVFHLLSQKRTYY